ncbi:hypothetical protein GCM10025881_11000 [Pseudolysinimonas kribbensis]|uniref:dTDP-4-dehydrorhamnose 3,5-epimerase n=1 Tax=Pseudolysinimonas kribbensis TaxID=433641 RepID=A0ABQ6K3G1_9MICO|nr:hypothetical protein GCM10025881_11000 [Pseudolysinimonas kribbensis]
MRGIHFADVPRGQAKYVTATRGAVLDYAIDIRVGSPTFGRWDSVLLDDVDRRAIYVAEGLGHCFVALTDDATVSYLVSDTYSPTAEHGVNPSTRRSASSFRLRPVSRSCRRRTPRHPGSSRRSPPACSPTSPPCAPTTRT